MFRLLRIVAVVGTIAFFSPVHDGSKGAPMPRLQDLGTAGLAALAGFLTASWTGPGHPASLLDGKTLQDAAVAAALRRSFDPATTSAIALSTGVVDARATSGGLAEHRRAP